MFMLKEQLTSLQKQPGLPNENVSHRLSFRKLICFMLSLFLPNMQMVCMAIMVLTVQRKRFHL